MFVDLHIHTYYSDGTMSVEEVVQKAKEKGVKVISITDHNRINAWSALKDAARKEDIIAIQGVEINCKYGGQVLHLLAYGFKETPELIELMEKADKEILQMSIDLVEKLSKEHTAISLEDYMQYEYDRKKGGWKGIHYLLDRGITQKLFDGFKYYKIYDCDFSLYDFPELKVLCEAISAADGYSVLAHPMEYYKDLEEESLLQALEALRVEGIQGIECYYPTHSKRMLETCKDFCKKYNLLITCGSDEHGEFGKQAKVIEQTIGCMGIEREHLHIEELLK